jgi:hypothetical protein
MQDLPPLPAARPAPQGFDAGPHTIEYPAVKEIYGCSKSVKVKMEFPADWQTARSGDGSDKSPQKMEEGTELGDGNFQMRGFALSRGRPTLAERQLHVSAFGRDTTPESWVGTARALGNFSLAQAEYYYDHKGAEAREEWLWNMKWRARLVRFTMPGNDNRGQTREASAGRSTGPAGALGGAGPNTDLGSVQGLLPAGTPSLDVLSQLVVH